MKKLVKCLIVVIVILIICYGIIFLIDYNRVANAKEPIFNIAWYEETGVKEYKGLGYKTIVKYGYINDKEEINSIEMYMFNKAIAGSIIDYNIDVLEENKSKTYSKIIDGTTIKLEIPNDWNYEENKEIKNDNQKFELNIYKNSKEKNAILCFYKDAFGVCGTGLTQEKLTLNNGMEASIGYYDGNEKWNFISFYKINPNIAIVNIGLSEDESKEMLEFIKTINIENIQKEI